MGILNKIINQTHFVEPPKSDNNLNRLSIEELVDEYNKFLSILHNKKMNNFDKWVNGDYQEENYNEEIEEMICIAEEMFNRGSSMGLLRLIESNNFMLMEAWSEERKDYVINLCQMAISRESDEHGLEAAGKYYLADLYQIEMWEKQGNIPKYFSQDGIVDNNLINKTLQEYTKKITKIVFDVLLSEYSSPYYCIKSLQLLTRQPYMDDLANEDPWWKAFWYHEIMESYFDLGPDYNAEIEDSAEEYRNYINSNNLEVTNEMLEEWSNCCPFIDEEGDCTLHPYKY